MFERGWGGDGFLYSEVLNKFEYVEWGGGGPGPCTEGGVGLDSCTGTPTPMNRHHRKLHLPATSLTGDKNWETDHYSVVCRHLSSMSL